CLMTTSSFTVTGMAFRKPGGGARSRTVCIRFSYLHSGKQSSKCLDVVDDQQAGRLALDLGDTGMDLGAVALCNRNRGLGGLLVCGLAGIGDMAFLGEVAAPDHRV